jgi:hypothetical protein
VQKQRSSTRGIASSRILAAFFAAGGEKKTYNFIWNRKKQPVLTGLLFLIKCRGMRQSYIPCITGKSGQRQETILKQDFNLLIKKAFFPFLIERQIAGSLISSIDHRQGRRTVSLPD